MKLVSRTCLVCCLLSAITHRLPAPIVETEEKPTPAPEQSEAPKPKEKHSRAKSTTSSNEPSTKPEPRSARTSEGTTKFSVRSAAPQTHSRFAGTWAGVTHTFPWGDISQTITVDATETTMTMVSSNGPDAGSPRTVKAERVGDTLKGNFGNRGAYSLTALADGVTALVRLQAPFN